MRTSETSPSQSPGILPGRSLRLVIVDDEPDTVLTLSAILVDEGHSVVAAHNGQAAIMEIRKGVPDALIVDISMPGISGYEGAREARRIFGDLAPMLIAMSGKWTCQTDRMVWKLAEVHHLRE